MPQANFFLMVGLTTFLLAPMSQTSAYSPVEDREYQQEGAVPYAPEGLPEDEEGEHPLEGVDDYPDSMVEADQEPSDLNEETRRRPASSESENGGSDYVD